MPPIQVSLDLFAVVLDGVLEADGRRRVRALSCRVTQAAQVGPEARCELPRDPAAVGVGDRPVQQARVVALSPRVEQLARLHPWLHRACKGDRGKPEWWWVHESRSDDDGDDEQDLKSDPTGHGQRDHPAYALMLRSRAPQLVRLPGLTARARRLGGRGHSHDVVYTARGIGWSIRRIEPRAGSRPRQARIAPRVRRVWRSRATLAAHGACASQGRRRPVWLMCLRGFYGRCSFLEFIRSRSSWLRPMTMNSQVVPGWTRSLRSRPRKRFTGSRTRRCPAARPCRPRWWRGRPASPRRVLAGVVILFGIGAVSQDRLRRGQEWLRRSARGGGAGGRAPLVPQRRE